MKAGYFIVGTDTGVGKTLIASALVHQFAQNGLKTVGMKPVAAGCELINGELISEDVTRLVAVSNVTAPLAQINPYAFVPAIGPHIAAQRVETKIELATIQKAYQALVALADVVIVEGAGGFCVPLSDSLDTAELAQALNLPIILVVGMRLGCLNHALLTVEAIQARNLVLAGWVANQVDPQMEAFDENLGALKRRINAPCVATVLWNIAPDLGAIKS